MKQLVIGASRGIGLEWVRQTLADGDAVTATARSTEAVGHLQSLGATAFALDVADAVSASGLAWRVDGETFERIVLVAGVMSPRNDGLEPPSQADFDAVMHANVLGAMRVLPVAVEVLAPGVDETLSEADRRALGWGHAMRPERA